eukprot:6590676-Prymnesium_polylepis.1
MPSDLGAVGSHCRAVRTISWCTNRRRALAAGQLEMGQLDAGYLDAGQRRWLLRLGFFLQGPGKRWQLVPIRNQHAHHCRHPRQRCCERPAARLAARREHGHTKSRHTKVVLVHTAARKPPPHSRLQAEAADNLLPCPDDEAVEVRERRRGRPRRLAWRARRLTRRASRWRLLSRTRWCRHGGYDRPWCAFALLRARPSDTVDARVLAR